ncbi:MAG: DUF362 domain-containing protein [Bryobacterales bacterium]|nr:DUF362 domain-containing protein [Bryobacterales bacterium]
MHLDTAARLSRRGFLAGAGWLAAQTPEPVNPYTARSTVSLVQGEDRRKNVYQALMAIDDQIRPALRRKKYVVVKPNLVAVSNQLASTHADAVRGILDYLDGRARGPVVIAESSRDETHDAFDNFHYNRLPGEYRKLRVSLVDLNDEGLYEPLRIIDRNLHMTSVRLARRLFDPDAFIISPALLKAHDVVVATLSVKNLALGAPLHSTPKDSLRWHDKSKYHAGYRQTHFDILLTAQRLRPYWGLAVIDGYEGLEGNGPLKGEPVPSRIALASLDPVAADRVGVEAMQVNPDWVGYLNYCCAAGLGQYDLRKIEIRGPNLAGVRRKYKLHDRVNRQLEWMGPLETRRG